MLHNDSLQVSLDQELELWREVGRYDELWTELLMFWIKDVAKSCLNFLRQFHCKMMNGIIRIGDVLLQNI